MHSPHLRKELVSIHVWRQTQTQATTNSFIYEDANILNPRRLNRGNTEGIFRMEFPLAQWLTALNHRIFGEQIWVSRITNFLFSIISLFALYGILLILLNHSWIAGIGAFAMLFSPSFYYHSINPMPDNLALAFTLLGIYFFLKSLHDQNDIMHWWAAVFFAGAALVKLPFIVWYGLPAFYWIRKGILAGQWRKWAFPYVLLIIFPIAWYAWVIPTWQGNIVVKGVNSENVPISETLDYLAHNLISTLPELLLNYAALPFFLIGLILVLKNKASNKYLYYSFLCAGIFVSAYYFYEINAIAKIHDYYLYPFYPLLFIIFTKGAMEVYTKKKWIMYLFVALAPILCYLRMQDRWDLSEPGFNKDLLIYKGELRNYVEPNSLVVVGNDESKFIWLYHLNRKGWTFSNHEMDDSYLSSLKTNGAKYLITDSDKLQINENSYSSQISLGSLQLFKLKK